MENAKQLAAMLMSKLEGLDLDKVKGLQIGIMFDKPMKDDDYEADVDEEEDTGEYHTMPDGSKMKGKEHPCEEDED